MFAGAWGAESRESQRRIFICNRRGNRGILRARAGLFYRPRRMFGPPIFEFRFRVERVKLYRPIINGGFSKMGVVGMRKRKVFFF